MSSEPTEPTGPNPDDASDEPSTRPEPQESSEPSEPQGPTDRPERADAGSHDAADSVGSGGRTWPIVLIVLGIVMLLLALGMQLPGPAYVGVVPLFYGLGTLAAARSTNRVAGQRRIALFSGLATVVLVFAIGTHLALAEEDLELDLGFGVLATVLAAALTGIHLAAKRGTTSDSA